MLSKAKRTHFLSLNRVLKYSDIVTRIFFGKLSQQKSIFWANLILINNLTINALFQSSDYVRIELIAPMEHLTYLCK